MSRTTKDPRPSNPQTEPRKPVATPPKAPEPDAPGPQKPGPVRGPQKPARPPNTSIQPTGPQKPGLQRPTRPPQKPGPNNRAPRNARKPTVTTNPYTIGPTPRTINRIAPKTPAEVKEVLAGAYSPIPIVFGEAWVTGRPVYFSTNALLSIIYIFCRGEVDSIQKLRINNFVQDTSGETPGTSFTPSTLTGVSTADIYIGTSGQDVSASNVGSGIKWTVDTMANFVVVALRFTTLEVVRNGLPKVDALIRGLKVEDSRNSPSLAYSSNPVACLGHFLTTYAAPGSSLDTTTFEAAANRADGIGTGNTLSDSSKRRIWSMIVGDSSEKLTDLTEYLEQAAGVFASLEDNTWYFVSDGPTLSSHTVNEDRIIEGTSSLSFISAAEKPDDVRVLWHDADNNVMRAAEADGTASGRLQIIRAPHITRFAEAKRYAIERYNRLRNENQLLQFDLHSDGLEMRRGEVITYTDASLGLSSRDFRITRLREMSPGTWRVFAREYLAGTYSDSLATDPFTGVGQPNDDVFNPPTLSISGTSTAVGRNARIDLTFLNADNSPPDALDYAFLDQIEVFVYDDSVSPRVLLDTHYSTSQSSSSISGLPADVDFYVEARIISSSGVNGTMANTTVSKPTLPTPSVPATLSAQTLGPAVVGDVDAFKVLITWSDVDFRTWTGVRVYYRVLSNTDYNNLSTPDPLPTTVDPLLTWDFSIAGHAIVNIPAPPYLDDLHGSDIYWGQLSLKFYNASGVESTEANIPMDDASPQSSLFAIQQGNTIADSFVTSTWTDNGVSGSYREIQFDFEAGSTAFHRFIGLQVNMYSSNASGASRTLIATWFIPLHEIAIAAGDNTTTKVIGTGGAATTPPSGAFAVNRNIVNKASEYRVFTCQYVGIGDQLSDEQDMTEASVSPENIVLSM